MDGEGLSVPKGDSGSPHPQGLEQWERDRVQSRYRREATQCFREKDLEGEKKTEY